MSEKPLRATVLGGGGGTFFLDFTFRKLTGSQNEDVRDPLMALGGREE